MSGVVSSPVVQVDLGAFQHNVRLLSSIAAPARTMLAVKANAYGHGLLPLANAALESGADSLAVLDVPTGLELRAAGITAQIFAWMHGPDTDFAGAVRANLDLGVSALWQLEAIAATTEAARGQIHLKIDTGLHRNGASVEDWPALVEATLAAERAGTVDLVGIWSHLADASPEHDAAALAQLHEAVDVARALGAEPRLLHLAASSAGIREPEARLDLVRFGIAAYGISPFDDESAADLGLVPVMTVRAPVVAINAGRATVGLGYADGIHVGAGDVVSVALAGVRHRIMTVDVDTLTIDIGDSPVAVGDSVTIFGTGDDGELTAEEWAASTGTIGDEIVVRASSRIPRTYLNAS